MITTTYHLSEHFSSSFRSQVYSAITIQLGRSPSIA